MRNHLQSIALVLALGASSSGCAAMMKAYVAQNCNREGAYAAGMNDAKEKRRMQPDFGSVCDSGVRQTVQVAYREGYTTGGSSGAQVNIAVASAERECVKAYGKEACGYGCVQAYGEVKCGSRPGDACVENYGKIVCGANCVKKFGDVVCD